MYNDSYLNKIILILFVIIVLFFGKVGLDYYRNETLSFNEEVQSFAIELVKGNKTLEYIDKLEVSDKLKEDFKSYYNNSFYSEDDLVLIYEDVSFFEKNRNKVDKLQRSYGEPFFNDPDLRYNFAVNESDDLTEEEIKFNQLVLNYSYLDKNKTSNQIIEKNNNLYIKAKDIVFNSEDFVAFYYEGLKLNVYLPETEKMTLLNRQNHPYYTNFDFISTRESDDVIIYSYKNSIDYADIYINLNCEMLLDRVKGIDISVIIDK